MSQPPYDPRYPANYPPPIPAPKPQYLADAASKKLLAGLMALFLGNLGIHKFVLGYTGTGVVMLLLNCTIIGMPIMRIISFIEGIMYLVKSDEEFYNTYIANQKTWF